ncbi:MAG: hypothetical protein ACPHRO_03175, partial [Nannocystaceae bacterium]
LAHTHKKHHKKHHHHHGHHHHNAHDGHEEAGVHLAGEALGILAGLLLCLGHIFNLRATRRCRKACCETSDPHAV